MSLKIRSSLWRVSFPWAVRKWHMLNPVLIVLWNYLILRKVHLKLMTIVYSVEQSFDIFQQYWSIVSEHQNIVGIDERFGPVVISFKREKIEVNGGTFYQYRIIVRTLEVSYCFSNCFCSRPVFIWSIGSFDEVSFASIEWLTEKQCRK